MAFQQVWRERTSLASSYSGSAESCLFAFKLLPEQLIINKYFYPRIAEHFAGQLQSEGEQLLEVTVWEDTSPVWWTDYKVQVVSTASPIAWAIIIPLILGILFLVALTFVIIETRKLIWGTGGGGGSLVSLLIVGGLILLAAKSVQPVERVVTKLVEKTPAV